MKKSPISTVRASKKHHLTLPVSAIALAGLVATFVVAPTAMPTALAASAPLAHSVIVPAAAATTVPLPRTAMAKATVHHWGVAEKESIAEVGAQVGNASQGAIAMGIDAPVLTKPRNAISQTVTVEPDTDYRYSVRVRVLSKTPSAKSIGKILIGSTSKALPQMNAKWKTVWGTYKTGPTETKAKIAVYLAKAVRGLSIDDVKLLRASDGTNVVSNPSFEDVSVIRGIRSTSLVTTTSTAAVALALPNGKSSWELLRGTKSAGWGSFTVKTKLTALPLKVSQGYYTLRVRASDGRLITTTVIVIDSPTPWVTADARFGVGLHVENGIYSDAALYTRALGISRVRNDLHWKYVEPRKGVYDFSLYDAPYRKLRAQGIKMLGIAAYGNAAYGSSNEFAPTTSAGLKAYGTYAAKLAKRYDLVGLEVYNEFNHAPHNRSGKTESMYYAPLVKALSTSVNKVKPNLPIVTGATARYPSAWFNNLWKKGALNYTDVMSFHPYETTSQPELIHGLTKQAQRSMKTYGGKTKPVWLTELGTSSRIGNRTMMEQASVLTRSAITGFAAGADKFFWYDLLNDTPDKADQMSNFGLYSHPVSGIASPKPKQAAFAQALTITQLGGRGFRKTESVGTGVVSKAFGKTYDTVRVVWAKSGTKTATIKTSKSVVVVKFDGTKSTVSPKGGVVKIEVGQNPVFVRSGWATAGVTK